MTRPDLKKAVLLLRYHMAAPLKPQPAFARYSDIARALRVKPMQVHHICSYYFRTLNKRKR